MTKQETIVEMLMIKGAVEVIPSKSRKYRQFTIHSDTGTHTYWVGRQGALRVGSCVSKSRSLTGFINHKNLESKIKKYNENE